MATNGERFKQLFTMAKNIPSISKEEKELIEYILRDEQCEFAFMKIVALTASAFPDIVGSMVQVMQEMKRELLLSMLKKEFGQDKANTN